MCEQKENNDCISRILVFLKNNVYLILALMIFLGFFQNYIYYQSFDIGVYNYSSPFDLLFYFIPPYIITPITIIMMILHLWPFQIIIAIIILYIFAKKPLAKYLWLTNICSWFTKICPWLTNICRGLPFIFSLFSIIYIFSISCLIIKLIYGLLTFNITECDYYFTNNFVNANNNQGYHEYFQILFSLWGIFIFIRLFRYLRYKEILKTIEHKFMFIIVFIIMILFTFNSLKTTQQVASLKYKYSADKKRIPVEDIKFIYNSDTISTNDSNFYIGSTKDYLFIRNIDPKDSNDTNVFIKLYNVNDIKFLKSHLIKKN